MPAVDKENFPKAIKWEDMILKKEKCVPVWELERAQLRIKIFKVPQRGSRKTRRK